MKKILYTLIAMIGFANVSMAQGYSYIKTLGTNTCEYYCGDYGDYILYSTNEMSKTLSTVQTLPFSWNFYGAPVSTFLVSTSGYITFDVTQTADKATNITLPNITAPKKAIFAFWDSLKFDGASSSTVFNTIRSWTYGTAPNQVFVIQWGGAKPIGSSSNISTTYFAVRIYQTGGFDIVENFGSGTFSATIGCQNATGTSGTQVTGSPNLNFGGPNTANGDYDLNKSEVYNFIYAQPSIWAKSVSSETSVNASTNLVAGIPISVKYTNWGSTAINSANLKYTINNGATVTQAITQIIASNGGVAILSTTTTANYRPTVSDEGTIKTLKVWLTNINGTTNTSDTLTFTVFVNKGISGTKRVLLEEARGAWASYDPDAELYNDSILALHGDSVIIVCHHEGDSMENTNSTSILNDFTGSYPSGLIDRVKSPNVGYCEIALSRNLWNGFATNQLKVSSPANISIINKTYNIKTRVIDYDVKVDFVDFALPGNIKLNTFILEDSVRGSNDVWNQSNIYSGVGVSTHPFYNFPNPIVGFKHNNVVKNIPTGARGNAYSIPKNPAAGSSYTQHFSYTLPALVSVTNADYTGQNNISNRYQNTFAGPARNNPNNIRIVAFIAYDSTDNFKRQIINSNQEKLIKNYIFSDSIICKGKTVEFNLSDCNLYNGSSNLGTGIVYQTPAQTTTYQVKKNGVNIGTITITVDSLTIQPITSSDTLSFCGYNTKFLIGINTSYNKPKNILWYKNDTLIAGKTLAADSFTTAGKYKVTLNTPTGCYQERTFTINKFNNVFNPDFAVNTQTATSQPFNFTFSNNTTPMSDYNFTWSWGDGNTAQNNNLINFYTYTSNGTYSVKLVAQNKLSGCKDSLVKANYITCSGGTSGALALNTNKTNPSCYGESNGSITVNATGGTTPYQYKLNTGSYQSTNSFTNLGAGIYTISVKDATNATVSKTDTLTNPTLLTVGGITGNNSVPMSSTQNYNIASQNGVVYTWNIINGTLLSGNGTNSIQVQWAAVAGMGKVIANIVKNSCSAADTLVVSIGSNPLILSTIKTDETCVGKANGAITINAVGGSAPYLYSINNGTYQTGNTFNNLVAGIYVSKVKDASNVISQKTDTINAGVGITAGAMNGPTAVPLSTLSTYIIGQQTGLTYLWNATNGIIATGQGTNMAQVSWGASAGTGMVKVKVTSAVGCIDSTILNVTIGSTNISNIGHSLSCSIYPNPVKDELIISTNQKLNGAHIIITDMIGRKMLEETITNTNNKHSILVSELKTGAYILSIQKDGESSRIKFVKE